MPPDVDPKMGTPDELRRPRSDFFRACVILSIARARLTSTWSDGHTHRSLASRPPAPKCDESALLVYEGTHSPKCACDRRDGCDRHSQNPDPARAWNGIPQRS